MLPTPTRPPPSLSHLGYSPGVIKHLSFIHNIMENLKFNSTQTVQQFKAQQLVDRIDVKKNPKTGKLFFTYGAQTGAVSAKGIPSKPMVSNVTTPEGDSFYLLHEEGQGAPTIATF